MIKNYVNIVNMTLYLDNDIRLQLEWGCSLWVSVDVESYLKSKGEL